jgi:hypothetical protein
MIALKGQGSYVLTVAAQIDSTEYVATGIGMALGETLESAGSFQGTDFWCGTRARPVSVRRREPTEATLSEYLAGGAQQGPTPYFFAVAIDWRGTAQYEVALPPGLTQVGRTVKGELNWPDLPAAQLRDYFATAEASKAVVDMWSPIFIPLQEAADKLPTWEAWKVALIVTGVVAVGGTIAVLIARSKR